MPEVRRLRDDEAIVPDGDSGSQPATESRQQQPRQEGGQAGRGPRVRRLETDEEVVQDSGAPEFLNQGIARSLGAPVDVANALLGVVGLDSENPVGGRESIEAAMDFVGDAAGDVQMTPAKGEQPETLKESLARGVGDAAGGLLPFAGVASGVARTGGAAGRAAQSVMQTTKNRPVASTGAELATGAAAGAGGQIAASQFPETEEARALGEIAGGLGLPAGVGALKSVPSVLVTRWAGKLANPLRPKSAKGRAGARLRNLAADDEAAAEAQGGETISDLTPAQRTGDKRLMALESAARRDDPELDQRLAEQQARADDQLQQAARSIGGEDVDLADTRAFLQKEAQKAIDRADTRLQKIQPSRREGEASAIVREEIENALNRARQQEARLFNRVPENVAVPTEATRGSLEGIFSRRDVADDPEDIPGFVRQLVGGPNDNGNFSAGDLGQETRLRNLQKFRSRVLREQRAERAKDAPNREKLSILNDLQESALEDMGAAAGGDDEAGAALRTALNFSRELNDRFTRGSVGRVLGKDKPGGPTTPSEMTLESTVGRQGERGRVATDEILNAVQDAPAETKRQVEEFIKNRFTRAAVKEGRLDRNSARTFLNRNEAILEQFPTLRQDIEAAVQGQKGADDFMRSNVGRFLNSRETEEIKGLLRAQSPRQAARDAMKQAGNDKTGKSARGLKRGLVDYIMDRARTGQFDEEGGQIVSGRGMQAAMREPKVRALRNEILTEDERQRLGRITRELGQLEKAREARPRPEGIINDTPSSLLSMMNRIGAAQFGRKVAEWTGGGTVQTPGIFSSRAKELTNHITNDRARGLLRQAVEDPELFKELIRTRNSGEEVRQGARRLLPYLAGPTSEIATGGAAEGGDGQRGQDQSTQSAGRGDRTITLDDVNRRLQGDEGGQPEPPEAVRNPEQIRDKLENPEPPPASRSDLEAGQVYAHPKYGRVYYDGNNFWPMDK